MLTHFILHTAVAAVPTHGDGFIEVGQGTIERLQFSHDREVLVGRDRASATGFVLEVEGWRVHELDPCGVSAVTTVPFEDLLEIYVGCDNGRVYLYELEDEMLRQPERTDGEPVYWQLETDDGQPASGSIQALFWNRSENDPLLYAYMPRGGEGFVHVLRPTDEQMDDAVFDGFPVAASDNGWVGGTVSGQHVYFDHGGGRATMVGLTNGTVSYAPINPGGLLYDVLDITPAVQGLWAADGSNDLIVKYDPLLGTYGATFLGFPGIRALSRNPGEDDDEFMIVAGDTTRVHEMSGGVIQSLDDPFWEQEDPPMVVDLEAGPSWTFGGTDDGRLQVFSARPWVDAVSLEPLAGVPGDELTMSFRINRPASWSVYVNGDRRGQGGLLVAQGQTASPNQTVQTTLMVGEDWAEGDNHLYVVAEGSNLNSGHARAMFTIDTPPSSPVLGSDAVRFGNQRLRLSFRAIDDADLDHVLVYVSDQPFEPADYPTGGPPGPEDGPESPLEVPATPGNNVDVTIQPLVNGVTYYLAVRYVDAGGLESPMSNVVSGRPQPTLRASDLAGEEGGGGCAVTPGSGATGLLAFVGALLLRRRRREAALAGLLVSGTAVAGDNSGDMTEQYGNFEIRYGPFLSFADQDITAVYGETGHEALQLELGPQLTRFFEIDLQFGFYQNLASQVSGDGDQGEARTMLTAYPLGVSGSARLHVLDEQVIVPFARLGMDYLWFSELSDNDQGGKTRVAGTKTGWHYALGANILLDTFAPGRASLLEAQTGINDTYLTIEYRRQAIDSRPVPWAPPDDTGFEFSGTMLTVGIKLDY